MNDIPRLDTYCPYCKRWHKCIIYFPEGHLWYLCEVTSNSFSPDESEDARLSDN